ncbi:RNA-binding protein 28 [Culex pipiens pallens]|uniref:RNA-binding protein 28 n=1 Tax=Culex pipiens pallens TaxID=42434 RepID=UPI001954719B|nr:RNA-binding protein 28 [Culex pipiens pallens]
MTDDSGSENGSVEAPVNGIEPEAKPAKRRNAFEDGGGSDDDGGGGGGGRFSKNAVRKRSREFIHRQCRLIVRNVSYQITDKKLREAFEKFGTLEEVNILKRPDGRLVGCAFLQYTKKEESDKAIANMDGDVFMGRKLEVKYAMHKKGFERMKTEVKKEEEIKEEEPEDEDVQETEIKEESEEEEEADGSDQEEEEEDDDEDEDEEEVKSEPSDDEDKKDIKPPVVARQKNHTEIEEGRTVFLKNVPYDADESSLKDVMSQFGIVERVLINKERISGHPKGTAFVIFKLKDSADMSRKQSYKLQVNNQFIEIVEALKKKDIKDKENQKNERHGKDSRNLYLLKEGLIMAGSPAAKDVSKTDMAQRLRLEQKCSQMLKNLSRFVARERLTIHNLPEQYTSNDLRKMVQKFTNQNPQECRVMRENRPSFGNPSGKSRGYGFLSFKKHEIALEVLRKLNNNPSVFGKNTRPIVSFSVEDRKVHTIKLQRLQKSKLNNPTYQDKLEKLREKKKEKFLRKKEQKKTEREQMAIVPHAQPNDAHKHKPPTKPAKKERKRKLAESTEEFTGEISRQGRVGIRSNRKINFQADAHMERLKEEKKDARKKRVKAEHERNRQQKATRRVKPKQTGLAELRKEDQYFQQTVGKYKDIISKAATAAGKTTERSKWYSA